MSEEILTIQVSVTSTECLCNTSQMWSPVLTGSQNIERSSFNNHIHARKRSLQSLTSALCVHITMVFCMKASLLYHLNYHCYPSQNALIMMPLQTPKHHFQQKCYSVAHLSHVDNSNNGFHENVHVDQMCLYNSRTNVMIAYGIWNNSYCARSV